MTGSPQPVTAPDAVLAQAQRPARPVHDVLLGVTNSVLGKAWRARALDEADIAQIIQRLGCSDVLARVLAGRGVRPDQCQWWLTPTLKDSFPDPSSFKDMDQAVAVLLDALARRRPTAVFADYDVDGATSGALLVRWFRAMGHELDIYVPDRAAEGYGPSPQAFETLRARGNELVITVDCGASAHEAAQAAQAIGLDLVVVDHHLMSGPPPMALACVNPNRPDCNSGQGHLTAAGVVLVLLAGLNRAARAADLVPPGGLPDLMAWTDLAALGTICDVAPLTGVNRAIVARGLQRMGQMHNPGIAALAQIAKVERPDQVYHAGFVLGPRLNAGGRIGESWMATRLLSSDDAAEIAPLAQRLDLLNTERREIERVMVEEALAQWERTGGQAPVCIVGARHWHPGVIGVAAGRLKEQLGKPVIVLGGDDHGAAKGSGRSVSGVNLGAAIGLARAQGLILLGGGHAMAAGLTIAWDKVPDFSHWLADHLADDVARSQERFTLTLDGLVALESVQEALIEELDRGAPFGAGNPAPRVVVPNVRVAFSDKAGDSHVRLQLEAPSGRKLKAIAFRALSNPLGALLMDRNRPLIHVAGQIGIDRWQGRATPQIEIADAALAK